MGVRGVHKTKDEPHDRLTVIGQAALLKVAEHDPDLAVVVLISEKGARSGAAGSVSHSAMWPEEAERMCRDAVEAIRRSM